MRDSSEQKVSTQDPKFMTITKFAWEEKAQQVKTLESKVEEMQKALEWYADKKNWNLGVSISMGSAFPLHEAIKADKGNRARQALKEVESQ